MLDRLPPEVLSLVLRQIRKKVDLKNLSQASKLLRQCTVPELYRSITFFASDEQNLVELGVDSFLDRNSSYLIHVKELHVAAPFHRRLRTRCAMGADLDTDDDEGEVEDGIYMTDYDRDDEIAIDATGNGEVGEASNHDRELDDEISDGGSDNEFNEANNHHNRADVKDVETTSDNNTSSNLAPPSQSVHGGFLEALESRLIPLFNRFPNDGLVEFSWNLGTCVPNAIQNYISNRQPSIKRLSIITDITCRDSLQYPYNSFRFTQLRKISWRGDNEGELQALGEILRTSAHLLEEAEIDYITRINRQLFLATPRSSFVQECLKKKPDERCVLFSSLRKLSLSATSFMHGIGDMLSAFNFSQLRSLRLRDCLGANELLDALASSSQALRLTSFELNFTGHFLEQWDLMPLARFLLSFEGLEDLFILVPERRDLTEEYWRSITHHMSTLERVVHQQRNDYLNPEYVRSGHGHVGVLLTRANLECLGICCLPNELTSSLAQLNPRPKIRILHIRATGYVAFGPHRETIDERADPQFSEALPDVLSFAHWVFGPDWLPELEILAYGDFSYQGRQPNTLLCRLPNLMENTTDESQNPEAAKVSNGLYRQVLKEDIRLWEIVQEHSDFLEACPEDHLLHEW